MGSRENRRVLVFVLVAALVFAFAAWWYHHIGARKTPEERAREKAAELQEKARGLTR